MHHPLCIRPVGFIKACFITGLLLASTGCLAKPDVAVTQSFTTGQFGRARMSLYRRLPAEPAGSKKKPDRNYVLQRMRLAVMTLADGYPDAAGQFLEQVYEILRTQGINKDKTVASVVLNEDLKIWKGEPFEQALAFQYIALRFAMQGSWDNVRAASSNSVFYLRDFGADDEGSRLDTVGVVDRAAAAHKAKDGDDHFLETGYTPVESNFTLGYLMTGIANQQLGRDSEADEQYAKAIATRPAIQSLVERLKAGGYNTLLFVDYGRGPQKIATGTDNAIAKFKPIVASDEQPLVVQVGGRSERFPWICDVNDMAQDHMWNNLEDMRIAKSHVGSVLLHAAAITAMSASSSNSKGAAYAAIGMALVGLAMKAGAHADTRYCEAMPQRIYIVPVMLTASDSLVELGVNGQLASHLALTGLDPPGPGQVSLRYVRLISGDVAPSWATSGRVVYANPAAMPDDGVTLPYILGGNCVRKPSHEVLDQYQRAGYLTEMSLGELEDLYRYEEIELNDDDAGGFAGLHVLEGGNSLAAPLPGSTGYARLFCQPHEPYRPRSPEVRDLAAQIQNSMALQPDAVTQRD